METWSIVAQMNLIKLALVKDQLNLFAISNKLIKKLRSLIKEIAPLDLLSDRSKRDMHLCLLQEVCKLLGPICVTGPFDLLKLSACKQECNILPDSPGKFRPCLH